MVRPVIASLVVVAAFLTSGCFANDQTELQSRAQDKFQRADNLEIAYASSYMFDMCGLENTGEALRKAVIAKLESCPFSVGAKQGFYKLAQDNKVRALQQVQSFGVTSDHYPNTIAEGKISCRELHEDKITKMQRNKLDLYRKGQLSLDDILPGSCETAGSIVVK